MTRLRAGRELDLLLGRPGARREPGDFNKTSEVDAEDLQDCPEARAAQRREARAFVKEQRARHVPRRKERD